MTDTIPLHQNHSSKILVKNLPEACDENKLKSAIENITGIKEGKVKNVKLDHDNHTGILEFYNAYSAEIVLKKRLIIVVGKQVQVEMFSRYLEADESLVSAKLMGLEEDIGDKLKTLQHDTEINACDQISITERTVNQQAELTHKLNAFSEDLRQKLNEAASKNQQQNELLTELSEDLIVARNVIDDQKMVVSEMGDRFAEFEARNTHLTEKLTEKSDTIQDLQQLLQVSSNEQIQLRNRISYLQDDLDQSRNECYSQTIQISEVLQDCEYTRQERMKTDRRLAEYQTRNKIASFITLVVIALSVIIMLFFDSTKLAFIYLLLFALRLINAYYDLHVLSQKT